MDQRNLRVIRVAKRLNEAIGYFELGQIPQSLFCLQRLGPMDDLPPFKFAAEVLRAELLKAEQRYSDAAAALEQAARLMPAPHNQAVWFALSMCYGEAGQSDLAVNSLGYARGAQPPAITTANP